MLHEADLHPVDIDLRYHSILHSHDAIDNGYHWRQDIAGSELADILEAGLVELEGEVVEP